MSETKHTPGPWVTRDADSPDVITADKKHGICTTHGVYATTEEKHANARLIAAAPTMLEALEGMPALLKDLAEVLRGEGDMRTAEQLDDRADKVAAALALAKGEQT